MSESLNGAPQAFSAVLPLLSAWADGVRAGSAWALPPVRYLRLRVIRCPSRTESDGDSSLLREADPAQFPVRELVLESPLAAVALCEQVKELRVTLLERCVEVHLGALFTHLGNDVRVFLEEIAQLSNEHADRALPARSRRLQVVAREDAGVDRHLPCADDGQEGGGRLEHILGADHDLPRCGLMVGLAPSHR